MIMNYNEKRDSFTYFTAFLYMCTCIQYDEEKPSVPKKIANLEAHHLLKYLCVGYAPE